MRPIGADVRCPCCSHRTGDSSTGSRVRIPGTAQAYAGSASREACKSEVMRRLPHRTLGENPRGTGRQRTGALCQRWQSGKWRRLTAGTDRHLFSSQGGKARHTAGCRAMRGEAPGPVHSRSLNPLPRGAGATPATCGSTSSGQGRVERRREARPHHNQVPHDFVCGLSQATYGSQSPRSAGPSRCRCRSRGDRGGGPHAAVRATTPRRQMAPVCSWPLAP